MGWFRKINKNGEDYKPIGNVITATSLSVSGPDLADGDVVRVMFTTDIAGSDTSTPLALTWNGGATPIPVKAMKNGSLVGMYAIEYAANLYRYISAYATLELVYDEANAQFVVVGNPVVLSGSNYTIYADGQIPGCPPVGAVYTQYPSQKSPEELWPVTTWQNISADYADSFFRAENTSSGHLCQDFVNQTGPQSQTTAPNGLSIPKTNTLSGAAGRWIGYNYMPDVGICSLVETQTSLPFNLPSGSTGTTAAVRVDADHSHTINGDAETRPINYTIRIWKRTA